MESSPIIMDDWDEPLSIEDLAAIDAAFEAACTLFTPTPRVVKRGVSSSYEEDGKPKTRRRLPRSIDDGINGCCNSPKSSEEIDAPLHAALEASCSSRSSSTPRSAPSRNTTNTTAASSSSFKVSPGNSSSAWLPSRRTLPGSFALTPCPTTRLRNYVSRQARYPVLNFSGRTVYCRTAEEVEKATSQILKLLEVKRKELGRAILGVDIEWKPSFSQGVPQGKAAVLQICGDKTHCYVLHIIHSGIPDCLKSLLEDPTSIKVGVAIDGDSLKMFQDHNVSIKPVKDLSLLANQKKLVGEPKQWSLAGLVETLTSKQLLKPKNIRLGNWEANILSDAQLRYAATDAFASWYLYEVLIGFPDLGEEHNQD